MNASLNTDCKYVTNKQKDVQNQDKFMISLYAY